MPPQNASLTATYSVTGTATGTGLRGQYYNDGSAAVYSPPSWLANPFTGSPALTRNDATVDFDWGGNSPGSGVTPDNFSAKWTGLVRAPVSGTYIFSVTGDDGVRLFLNGVKVIEGWKDQGPTTYTCFATLTANTLYQIESQYYEHGAGAVCRLHWTPPGQQDQAIPSIYLSPPTGTQVAAPVFNPAPGTYTSAQSVAMTSATTGAFIRYTTDGSTPTASVGTLYSGPVAITSTKTLKAIASKTGMDDSALTSGTYTVNTTPMYTLTVTGGTGSGSYPGATAVPVSATPPAGQAFSAWTGDTEIIPQTDLNKASTTATMPQRNASLTATYSASGGAGTGLQGQYYNDGSGAVYPLANPFTGSAALTRIETVDFNWGGNSPGSGVNVDNFSTKWTGQVKAPVSGSYTFSVTADDGVRLFLSGAKVIEGWKDQSATTYTCTATLAAGTLYNIELHYYEHGDTSRCQLHWSYPGQPDQAIPQSQLSPPAGQTTGTLTREVWTGVTGASVSNIPTGLAPNYTGALTSFEAPGNWADNYGTRVRGYITAPATGNYRFWIASDNASELWLSTDSNPVNKRRIARVIGSTNSRQWTKESNQRSAAISLVQGQRYYVEALQKEGTGGDNLAVSWAKPGQSSSAPSEIVPGAVLTPF
jgi:hypothetical protein